MELARQLTWSDQRARAVSLPHQRETSRSTHSIRNPRRQRHLKWKSKRERQYELKDLAGLHSLAENAYVGEKFVAGYILYTEQTNSTLLARNSVPYPWTRFGTSRRDRVPCYSVPSMVMNW